MSSNTNGPESRVRGAKNLPWNRNLRIGTLNVRTLAQPGSLESLKTDLKKYKLDVLGVQKTRLEEQEIDDESCVCSGCKRRFDTARGCKVHEARFCKSKNSKSVKDSASKFVGLEISLNCQKCTRKFATVKSRRIHESRYCGREKAGRSRIFSCNVQDRDGVEF